MCAHVVAGLVVAQQTKKILSYGDRERERDTERSKYITSSCTPGHEDKVNQLRSEMFL